MLKNKDLKDELKFWKKELKIWTTDEYSGRYQYDSYCNYCYYEYGDDDQNNWEIDIYDFIELMIKEIKDNIDRLETILEKY